MINMLSSDWPHTCNVIHVLNYSVTYARVSLRKGLAPGKLISCEDDFGCLVWPFRGKFLLWRSSVQNVCLPEKTSSCLWKPLGSRPLGPKVQLIGSLDACAVSWFLWSLIHVALPCLFIFLTFACPLSKPPYVLGIPIRSTEFLWNSISRIWISILFCPQNYKMLYWFV